MNQIPIIQGATLTASTATYYTVPTNDVQLKSMKLTSMRFLNHDTVTAGAACVFDRIDKVTWD